MKINLKNLELAMAKECMTFKDLTDKANIHDGVIYKIKIGFDNFRPATVGKIAKALNVPVVELIEE